jgi:murein DD-endopeptidase MepM/ murein hydrolase activator NlpD
MTKRWMVGTLLYSLIAAPAVAQWLPNAQAVPGGIAVVTLNASSEPRPTAHYRKHPVLITEHEGRWTALIGVPLDASTGEHHLGWKRPQQAEVQSRFQVVAKDYPEQHITIKDKRKVNPEKRDYDRIRKESERLGHARKIWRDTTFSDLELQLPVEGRRSSAFGLKRFYNEQPRKPHSGLDIAAAEGSPVVAPLGGVVILTGDLFFSGNTVFLDHGQGLLSSYAHLSKVLVSTGDHLSSGQMLGRVGQTGRATGPHLHWSVYLNQTRIDPALLLR